MIKTCSLEFIDKEVFEVDILNATGEVLFSSEDKVTPERILKLYFKEIYIKERPVRKAEPIIDEDTAVEQLETITVQTEEETLIEAELQVEKEINAEPETNVEAVMTANSATEAIVKEAQTEPELVTAAVGANLAESEASETKSGEKSKGKQKGPIEANTQDTIQASVELETRPQAGPVPAYQTGTSEETSTTETKSGPTPSFAFESAPQDSSKSDSKSGPRVASDQEIINAEVLPKKRELGVKAGPSFEDDSEDNLKDAKSKTKTPRPAFEAEGEVEIEENIDKDLKFDETRAKRIANISVKVAKILGFPQKRLDELKEAAYYHNIAITGYKQSDLKRKGFRREVALASYNILLNEMNMPPIIAETAKFCINNYASSSFNLEGEIPYHQIVAITSYYEDLLDRNYSKEKALGKMLQLGGNKFNIFVLHKFIKIMKDSND